MQEGSMFRLDGRKTLVVGGGNGLGRASAVGLAGCGARVVVADIDTDAAKLTVEHIAELGRNGMRSGVSGSPPGVSGSLSGNSGPLSGYDGTSGGDGTLSGGDESRRGGHGQSVIPDARWRRLDVRDSVEIAEMAEEESDTDVLVITPSVNVRKRLVETDDEEFERVVDVNLKGTYRLMRSFGTVMAKRGRGSIISFASFRAFVVEPGQGIYSATKAGVLQLTRALAVELGPFGVRVNAIAPGPFETPLTQQIKAHPEWHAAYANKTAFKRWAQPHEIAGAVVYLASDASSYTTGSLLSVDGGWTAIDGRFDPAV